MKSIFRNIYITLIAVALVLLPTGCIYDIFNEEPIPEGVTTVGMEVNFAPYTIGLDQQGTTRSAGNAIKSISNICVLFYKPAAVSGEPATLAHSFYAEGSQLNVTDVDRDQTGKNEAKTPQATTTATGVPYGKYYIYVVANMGDIAHNASYDVGDSKKLRSIPLKWEEKIEDVGKNNQMFGFFSSPGTSSPDVIGNDVATETAPLVTINKAGMSLQAWVQRAASKVTIAYDGTNLYDGVRIWVKSVRIADIPKNCLLGVRNKPNSTGELIPDGEKIVYNTSDEGYEATDANRTGIYLSNGHNVRHRGAVNHLETDNALYFFENAQGEGPRDKAQNAEEIKQGIIVNKDDMPYGTWIEVEAYYDRALGESTQGPIIYRFMLGQDIVKDFNAFRNHHYKLTLRFRNNGNDVDWHIEYADPEPPGIYVHTPQYVPYSYNQETSVDLKVQGEMVGDLKAEIIENHWYSMTNNIHGTEGIGWSYNNTAPPSWTSNDVNRDSYNGFLSLVKPVGAELYVTDVNSRSDQTANFNVVYNDYFGQSQSEANAGVPQQRRYNAAGAAGSTDKGKYTATNYTTTKKVGEQTLIDKKTLFAIPLFTRQRSITEWTGHSGANPFYGKMRYAKIRFTCRIKDPNTNIENDYETFIEVRQARRIVNPRAIWRKAGSTEYFDANIMVMNENENTFIPLESEGSWSAEPIYGNYGAWFSISPIQDGASQSGNMIKGTDRSKVAFRFKPTTTDNAPKFGIIKILYHNNMCTHYVFVRQGYEAVSLVQGGESWSAFNVKSFTAAGDPVLCTDPRDFGTYFRWGRTNGIPVSEDRRSGFGFNVTPGTFNLISGTSTWSNLGNAAKGTVWNIGNNQYRLPDQKDYEELENRHDGNSSDDVNYAYGVLYADGATETQKNFTQAFEYYDDMPDRKSYGMRGLITYNEISTNQMFLPTGPSGFGRRVFNNGSLRYGGPNVALTNNTFKTMRPLLQDLYKQYGAIYWTSHSRNYWYVEADKENGSIYCSWEFNYSTYNNETFKQESYGDKGTNANSDALPIRMIKTLSSASTQAKARKASRH